jgi:hypothetical protein
MVCWLNAPETPFRCPARDADFPPEIKLAQLLLVKQFGSEKASPERYSVKLSPR